MARPAASSFLGWLVGVSKHCCMDCRGTRELPFGLVIGWVVGLVIAGVMQWLVPPATASVAGHLVVVGKLCSLSRKA